MLIPTVETVKVKLAAALEAVRTRRRAWKCSSRGNTWIYAAITFERQRCENLIPLVPTMEGTNRLWKHHEKRWYTCLQRGLDLCESQ